MQNIHPWFVHFPIALLVSSFIFELLGQILKNTAIQTAAKWNLWLAALFASITVGTGWHASETVSHTDASHQIMELHKQMGWIIFIAASVLSLWKLKAKPEWQEKVGPVYLLFLTVLISITLYSAHLGGRLVYEHGAGTNWMQTNVSAISETNKEVSNDHGHNHSGHSHSQKKDSPALPKKASTESGYYCPMKCEGNKTYSQPGRCPVCGMNLTSKK